MPPDPTMHFDAYRFPFWVTGLTRYDLAVFASVIDKTGGSEQGYLVTRIGHLSQLALPEVIEIDNALLTAELAKRIATVSPEEIATLGIEKIVRIAQQRYPDIRRIS